MSRLLAQWRAGVPDASRCLGEYVNTIEALQCALELLEPLPDQIVLAGHPRHLDRARFDLDALYDGRILLLHLGDTAYAAPGICSACCWAIRNGAGWIRDAVNVAALKAGGSMECPDKVRLSPGIRSKHTNSELFRQNIWRNMRFCSRWQSLQHDRKKSCLRCGSGDMDFGPHDPGIYREEDPPEVTHFALGCMRAVRPRETSILHRENSCPLCIPPFGFPGQNRNCKCQ